MPTINQGVDLNWQKIANDTDSSFSASWEATVDVEFLATSTNVAPTGDGKKYRREIAVNRQVVGEGYIWARLSPGSKPSSITILVNTSGASGSSNPFSGSGSITTQNLVPAGVATANSAVEVSLNNATSLAIQTVGTYTGALSVQVTGNGTDWITLGGTPILNVNTGALSATIASATVGAFQVNVGGFLKARVTGLAAMTGSVSVNLRAHQGAAAVVPVVGAFQATQPVSMATNTPILAAGTNLAADVGTQLRANATGAATIKHVVSAATTNATSTKASAGRVVGWNFVNTTAAYQYVKLHNVAVAPTPGAAVAMTIAIPPNGVNNMPISPVGIGFATGIGYSIVTGSADADATATTAGSVVGDLHYA